MENLTESVAAWSGTPVPHAPTARADRTHAAVSAGTQDAELRQAVWEARAAAAILDLVLKLGPAEDVRSGCIRLTGEVRAFLGCDRVAVGLRRGKTGRCRLMAVSDVADLDHRNELPRRLEAAMDETLLRDAVTVWPPMPGPVRDDAAAHRELASMSGTAGLLGAPLRSADGCAVGAWLLFGSKQFAHGAANQRLVEAASLAVGGTLELLTKAQPGPVRRAGRQLARAMPLLRGKTLWAVVAAALLVLAIPMPYYVSVECELQPQVRRFVAAPFAGEFQKSLVKPGDLVNRGQTLGRMEGREIRWEFAGLGAEQQRASKSRDVNLAGGKIAAAQIDQLESQRQEVKRQLLDKRLEHLDVKSPIDGIVVSGDLERSEGVPVTVGQVLFEVAPLDPMTAELAIPDEEIARVDTGMSATVMLDAFPGCRWSGDLVRIHPRSVTREKDNVFLGEIVLGGADGTLRPGMKGHARVRTASHCLGWILFHKPWNYLASWLGW